MELKRRYDTSEINSPAFAYVPTVRMEDMETLFACKEGFRIHVNNIRHAAVLFDALLERSYIQAHWQSGLVLRQ